MTFDTISFCIFMAVMLPAFYCIPVNFRKYLLLFGSVVFYISLDWNVFCLAAATVVLTYWAGIHIEKRKFKKKSAKCCLIITIAVLALALGLFKYLNFFSEMIDVVLKFFHAEHSMRVFELLAVTGISYYTLKAVSYLVEVYQGNIAAERSLVSYGTYLLFFPQIIAGPMDTPDSFLTQINKSLIYKEDNVKKAIVLIATGYMKKLAIANLASQYVNTIYDSTQSRNGLSCLFGVVLYSMQIYCDFSGYSDISIGISALFGIEVKKNFNCPYLAVSIKDFWRRWHISLSLWLRNYIYIPCGGSREGRVKKIRNTLITFLVSGLWHGAAFTYVFWGLYHGVLDCFCRKINSQKEVIGKRTRRGLWKIPVTFLLVTIGWIFFRADSFAKAFEILEKICMHTSFSSASVQQMILVFTGDIMSLAYFLSVIVLSLLLLVREYRYTYGKLAEASTELRERESLIWTAFCVFAIVCLGNFGTQGFIYANF